MNGTKWMRKIEYSFSAQWRNVRNDIITRPSAHQYIHRRRHGHIASQLARSVVFKFIPIACVAGNTFVHYVRNNKKTTVNKAR